MRLLGGDALQDGVEVAAQVVRILTDEQFIQNHAERIDIRARVHGLSAGLLGSHVAQRADDRAGLRQVQRGAIRPLQRLGQAEVQNLRPAALIHKDVRGLEVAVDDSVLVRVLHRFGDLGQQGHDGFAVEFFFHHMLAKAATFDEFHHAVGHAPDFAAAEDAGDVRVVEPRGQFHLALEKLHRPGVRAEGKAIFAAELDRDGLFRGALFRQPDHTHPTAAQMPDHAIAGNLDGWDGCGLRRQWREGFIGDAGKTPVAPAIRRRPDGQRRAAAHALRRGARQSLRRAHWHRSPFAEIGGFDIAGR